MSPVCEYIIHACGPRYLDGKQGEAKLLALTHQSIINLAIESNIKSIVSPPISTGVYRFPVNDAANIAVSSVATAIKAMNVDIDVYFAMKDASKYHVSQEALSKI